MLNNNIQLPFFFLITKQMAFIYRKIIIISALIVIGFVISTSFGIIDLRSKNCGIVDQAKITTPGLDEMTKLEYKKAIITHTFCVEKFVYNTNEEIEITPKLVNHGDESVTIIHADPMSFTTIYDQNKKKIWSYPYLVQDIGIMATIEPSQSYGWDKKKIQERHDIKISLPGTYTIESYAQFVIHNSTEKKIYQVFSEPVVVTIKKTRQL